AIARYITRQPPPVFTRVGGAVARSAISLHKDPNESSKVAGSLAARQPVELLNSLPPLPLKLDEWTLVRAQAQQDVRGYVHIGDLDEVQTSDAEFNLWHAFGLFKRSSDPADRKARLEAIDRALQSTLLPASRESDDLYLEVSKDYAALTELNLNADVDAAKAAL